MAGVFPESRVVKIWQDCLAGRTDLVTEDDGPVEVVYPGRLNDGRGADLRDAVIAVGQRLRRGEVEIHVRSSSWWGHGHYLDPSYNRVILHVVYQYDTEKAVVLQDGRRVPTLALEKFVAENIQRSLPCRPVAARYGDEFIGGTLNDAGDLRFAARVAEFQAVLSRVGADQALYESIMGALGYTKNKTPMIELARRLPLSRLIEAAPPEAPDDECLARYQALLLGMAGLLPSDIEGWAGRLRQIWKSYGVEETMDSGDWHSFKVRPGNLPCRRLAAMSYLLLRFRDEGLLAGLVQVLESAAPETARSRLENSLLVEAGGFWGGNLDFSLPGRRAVPALLGVDRAGVIVVNVLLPFTAAWGKAVSRPGLTHKAIDIYRRYPALAENALERHMRRQLGVSRMPVGSARRQQGIIYMCKTLCSQGRCLECPLVVKKAINTPPPLVGFLSGGSR